MTTATNGGDPALEARIADYVRNHREAMIGFLRRVVQIPSVWGDAKELSRLAQFIGSTLSDAGVKVEYPECGTAGMTNMMARLGNGSSGRRFLFCGHMDVYPPSHSWTLGPFDGTVRENRLHGAGSSDMKGGTAAMAMAATVLAALGEPKGGEVIALAVPNHFEGGEGTRRAFDAGLSAEAGIICEPTDLDICAAQRGILYVTVHVRGIAAHTIATSIGVNAIERAQPVIAALKSPAFVKPNASAYGDEKIVNIAMIHGGLRHNLIPEDCRITVDIRFAPSTSAAKVLADVRDILARLAAADPTFKATAEPEETCIKNPRSPMPWVEHPVREVLAAAHARVLGKPATLACHPAWPDTPVMIERGVPSITYGPGSKLCYWDDEYVSLDEYINAIQVYATTATRWLNAH